MREWDVYLEGYVIDTVFFKSDMTEGEVYAALVYHDGYDEDIELQSAGESFTTTCTLRTSNSSRGRGA